MIKSWRRNCAVLAVAVLGASTLLVHVGGASAANSANTSPILVGGVWSASVSAGTDIGAEAAFNAFNAAGGLNGRKIKFIGMEDDGQSPTSDIAAAKTLVNDHVFAVVPVMTSAWVGGKILAQAGIPYFGWATSTGWWGSSNGFSLVGAAPPDPKQDKVVQSVPAEICLTVKGGCKGKTVALVAINNAAALNTVQLFAAEWKQVGAKVVAQVTSIPEPPTVVSDFTPFVNQLLSANSGKQPDIIQQLLPPEDDVSVIAQLNHQGFTGKDYNFSLYDPRAVAVAKGSDTLVTFAPWEQNSAAIAQMTTQVKATDPNAILGQPVEAGYWSAQMFIAALKKVGPSVTQATLTKALNKGWTFSVPGGTGPVTYPAAHTGPGGCGSIVASNGQKYSVALPLTCIPFIKNPLLG
jgi:branched-chain amino acid transport system substrate-binding protein